MDKTISISEKTIYGDINCVDFPVVKARRLSNGKLEIIRYTQFEQVVV